MLKSGELSNFDSPELKHFKLTQSNNETATAMVENNDNEVNYATRYNP